MTEHARVLVTGGAGFMGSWLVDELVRRGHNVVSVDDLSGGSIQNVNKKSKFIKADVRHTEKIEEIVRDEKIDVIYHLAAYAAEGQSIFSPVQINDINIKPMNNLLVAAVNNDVKKFVFTSSMAVYGKQKPPFDETMATMPEDPYGCAKAYCERMLEIFSQIYDFNYTIIRPHNVYGPRQNISDPYRNVLGIWINSIMRSKPPYVYGDGNQTRAFSFVQDAIIAIANAGFFGQANREIINVGSEEVVTINEALKIVLETMNSKLKPIYVEERPGETKHAYCTVKKSEKLLDYRTTTRLREGIQKMVNWAREWGPQKPTYRIPLEIRKKAPRVWREQLI
jgi:UDP-glucose 4-epimerase